MLLIEKINVPTELLNPDDIEKEKNSWLKICQFKAKPQI
jgi:hypothetical protein